MIYTMNRTNKPVMSDFDQSLIWSVVLLLSLGLIMVYSASIVIAEAQFGEDRSYHYLLRHSAYLFVGFMLGLMVFQIPVYIWQKYAIYPFLLGVILLMLVLIPGLGIEVNGSQRWIPLLVVNVQPSEFMKLFIVIYVADYVLRKSEDLNHFRRGFLPVLIVLMVIGTLLLMQPDFGAFVVITLLVFSLLFLGGLSMKIVISLFLAMCAGFYALILSAPYRMERLTAFMDPWADPYGKGYQLSHALIAFGRGEWFGVGLGGSVEKQFYLPEAHTDFILAVLAEELGFVGVAVVIALFVWLVFRAFVIGRRAAKLECHYAALVAQAIGIWFGMQAFINMGVNMGILPTKGLTLPLMSFGGSSIVANCIALAVLLRVDWENRQRLRGNPI